MKLARNIGKLGISFFLITVCFICFQNFTASPSPSPTNSSLVEGFENNISKWQIFNNCAQNSTAGKIQFVGEFKSESFEGSNALRMQTFRFSQGCSYPGLYALSASFPIRDGRVISVRSQIKNNNTIPGAMSLIFYDRFNNEMTIPSGVVQARWPTAGPTDWPRWHQVTIKNAKSPTGAYSFRIRYELQQANSIVDIDSLEISGHQLKGVLFNPIAVYKTQGEGDFKTGLVNIGSAWILNMTAADSSSVSVANDLYASLFNEVKDVSGKGFNLLYVMVSSDILGWPAEKIQSRAYENLAKLVKIAYQNNIQIGFMLSHRCTIYDLAKCNGTRAAQDWYKNVILGVETKLSEAERMNQSNFKELKNSIAFWEMAGHPTEGAAEIPLWNGAPELRQVQQFVKKVWPKFIRYGVRPKAISFLPIYSDVNNTLSSLTNFQAWTKWWCNEDPNNRDCQINGQNIFLNLQPDYFIFTSSINFPLDQVLNLKKINIGNVPAEKILLGDFKWGGFDKNQNGFDPYNPGDKTPLEIVMTQLSRSKSSQLAGWWIWGYRDKKPYQLPNNDMVVDRGLRQNYYDGNLWKTNEQAVQYLLNSTIGFK